MVNGTKRGGEIAAKIRKKRKKERGSGSFLRILRIFAAILFRSRALAKVSPRCVPVAASGWEALKKLPDCAARPSCNRSCRGGGV